MPLSTCEVRKNVLTTLQEIHAAHGRPDALAVQEAGNINAELPPYFKGPVSTDLLVELENKRTVCTYARKNTDVIIPNLITEICVTIVECRIRIKGKGHVDAKVGLINSYRNQHKDTGVTLATHVSEIERAANTLRFQHKIGRILIVGDFNNTRVRISGFRELHHPSMFYQQRAGTAKRNIDKVFSNFPGARITEVKNSCENKEDKTFGHKVIVIRVGSCPRPTKETRKLVSLRKMKAILKFNHSLSETFSKNLAASSTTEQKAQAIIDYAQEVIKLSMFKPTSMVGRTAFTLDMMQTTTENFSKNTSTQKKWYKFYDMFKSGISSEDTLGAPPSLREKTQKLIDTLKDTPR